MSLGQEAVGQRIKEARDAAGLTQQDLADLVGVVAQTISRWERAEIEISARQLRRVAEATRQPLSFFIREVDVATQPDALLERIQRLEEELLAKLDEIERRLPPEADSAE